MRREQRRRPQSVKKGIWYLGGKKRSKSKKGGTFPFGLRASTAAPLLREIAKPVFKQIFGMGRRRKIR